MPSKVERRDWRGALRAFGKLMADSSDTTQVFTIMRALDGASSRTLLNRLISLPSGGRLAYDRAELAPKLDDLSFLTQFPKDSVGAAYCAFRARTGYSAGGLAQVSDIDPSERHPIAWLDRRERDLHDLWHILTGYHADEDFGEVCLAAFSFAQTRRWGWAFIALADLTQQIGQKHGIGYLRAVWEAYGSGQRADWLLAQDPESLLSEPLDAARTRLKIFVPKRYLETRLRLQTGT